MRARALRCGRLRSLLSLVCSATFAGTLPPARRAVRGTARGLRPRAGGAQRKVKTAHATRDGWGDDRPSGPNVALFKGGHERRALLLEKLVYVDRERPTQSVERPKCDVELARLDLLVVAGHDPERLGRALLRPSEALALSPQPCHEALLKARLAGSAGGNERWHRLER